MPTLAEIRQQYPQYNSIPDAEFADKLYNKFYAGKIERAEFDKRVGVSDWRDAEAQQNLAAIEQSQTQPASPVRTGSFLPISRNTETGEVSPAIPEGIKSGVKLPGQVLSGEKQISELTPGDTLGTAALMTPINPAVRAGDKAFPGVSRAETRAGEARSSGELKGIASRQFDQFRGTDIRISPDAARDFSLSVRQGLMNDGFLTPDAKSTYNVLKMLEGGSKGAFLTGAGVHSARKALNRIAGNYANPTDQAAASRTLQALDEWFEGLPASGFMAQTSPEAIGAAKEAFKSARGNWAAAEQSDKLAGRLHAAELRSAAANSGKNLDNAIRQRIAGLLTNESARRGFTAQQIQELEKVVNGGVVTNLARDLANLTGGGGGLGQMLTAAIGAGAGQAMGGPVGAVVGAAVPAVAGRVLKAGENALTRRRLRRVEEGIRGRAPAGPTREPVGVTTKAAGVKAAGVAIPRADSLEHIERVVSAPVLEDIKSRPETRKALHEWLVARNSRNDVEGATRRLAEAIAKRVGRDDLVDRIVAELGETVGPN